MEWHPGVGIGDDIPPRAAVSLPVSDLSGDISDHRPKAGQLARRV
jgi:hypothetical protein